MLFSHVTHLLTQEFKTHGDHPRFLILHISEKHKEDSNVKNLAKKQKNQKTPCGECGKLYSDSGLRAHMIRVSFFSFNARLITYSTRIEVRNCCRTLFTFEHTALLFW